MTSLPVQAEFNGQSLDIIVIGGDRWLRGSQLVTPLGFTDQNAIRNILRRNPDDFGLAETMLVSLPAAKGGEQLTRIFSERGAGKLALLAKTPQSTIFRSWVMDRLTAPQSPPVLELHGGIGKTAQNELRTFWLRHTPNRKFLKYVAMPLSNSEIAKLCDWKTAGTVTKKRRAAEVLGLIAANTRQIPSSLQRHVALQRAASASLALSSHAG